MAFNPNAGFEEFDKIYKFKQKEFYDLMEPYLKRIHRENLVTGNGYDGYSRFNRMQTNMHYLNMDGYVGYAFMGRPDLNLYSNGAMIDEVADIPYFNELNKTDVGQRVLLALQSSGKLGNKGFNTPWLPAFTNYVQGYTPINDEIEFVERGETYQGSKIMYAKHSVKARTGGTTNLTFEDDRNKYWYLTIKTWTYYMHLVSSGVLRPNELYMNDKILDYSVPIYYIVTRMDRSEIIYWEKLTGVFPKDVPDSIFATTKNELPGPFSYDVQFVYSIKNLAMDPRILSEFNYVTNGGTAGLYNSSHFIPIYDYNFQSRNPYSDWIQTYTDPLVKFPLICRGAPGTFAAGKFYLEWVGNGMDYTSDQVDYKKNITKF